MTEFQTYLDQEIVKTMERHLKQGTVGMSVDCLRQNVSTLPLRGLKGSPLGTNAPYVYGEEFKAAVERVKGKVKGFDIY